MEIINNNNELLFKTKLNFKNEYDPNLETHIIEEEMLEQTNIMISKLKGDLANKGLLYTANEDKRYTSVADLFSDIDVDFDNGYITLSLTLREMPIHFFDESHGSYKSLLKSVGDTIEINVNKFEICFDEIILKMNREEHINSIADKYGKLHQIINESYMIIIQNDKDVMFKYPIKSNNKTIVGVDRGGKLIIDNGYTNDHIDASEIRNDFETLTIIADEILNKNK